MELVNFKTFPFIVALTAWVFVKTQSLPENKNTDNNLIDISEIEICPQSNPSDLSESESSQEYNDKVKWLSKIISAEAKGEPLKGKIAVANSVLNRVKSKQFPNTIYGVIMQKGQYDGVGTHHFNYPNKSCINAAVAALSGQNYIGDCVYYANVKIATDTKWINKLMNKSSGIIEIGNHTFFLN